MKPFKKSGAAAAAAMAVLLTLLLAASAAYSRPLSAPACMQLGKLKRVFPAANAVGSTGRSHIKVQEARAPVFPGRCGAFRTTYTLSNGEGMDVGVTLYKTARDVGAPLAEPAAGVVHVLPNGARVRYSGPDRGSVDGTPSSSILVVSAFRRLFISSTSISTSMKPVPISDQLRLHRRIENRFARLVGKPVVVTKTGWGVDRTGHYDFGVKVVNRSKRDAIRVTVTVKTWTGNPYPRHQDFKVGMIPAGENFVVATQHVNVYGTRTAPRHRTCPRRIHVAARQG
jgi:hypothetical protein